MTDNHISRRDAFLQFAAFGAAAPLALNLAAIGSAAAANATDYKALVCVFLLGGNDSHNMLLATDADSWSRYWTARWTGVDPIGLMPPRTPKVAVGSNSGVTGRTVSSKSNPEYWGGVLPVAPKTAQAWPAGTKVAAGGAARTFAVHPLMPNTQALFNQGRIGALANVGTLLAPLTKAQYQAGAASGAPVPPRLFSHSDQQSAWQSGQVGGVGVTGWGGEIEDSFAAQGATGLDFMSVTTAGQSVFPAGATVQPYRVNVAASGGSALSINVLSQKGSYNGSTTMLAALKSTILPAAGSLPNDLATDYATTVARSVSTSGTFGAAIAGAGSVPAPGPFTNPLTGAVMDNPLADQLYATAQTIAVHGTLNVNRQVFFASLGSFDTHDAENSRQSLLLAQVDHALAYFDGAMNAIGLGNAVTTFTASDFNRTFTTNGDGTDHGWGGHHLMMGGAVKGGDIYGQYPTLGIDVTGGFQNPNGIGTALLPTTSVDQYLGTMAAWFGVDAGSLANIFPNLAGFGTQNLGFMKTS